MSPAALLGLLALSGTHHRDRTSTQQRQLEESLDEDHYVEHRFKQKVSKALASAQKVLSTARNPTFAEDQPHSYDDKYALAEHLTSVSIAAQLNVLESIGLTAPMLEQSRRWAADGKTVTLRLSSTERTSFLREATSDIPRSTVVKNSGIFGTSESQVVTRRQEYFWAHTVEHEVLLFAGVNATAGSSLSLQKRTGRVELMTTLRESPHPEVRVVPEVDVELSWLLRQLTPSLQIGFRIDRAQKACRTPRRNPQADAALRAAYELHAWATAAFNYLIGVAGRARPTSANGEDGGRGKKLDLAAIADRAGAVFVPVLPLFEERNESSAPVTAFAAPPNDKAVHVAPATCAAPLLMRLGDVESFLAEQRRTFAEAAAALTKAFPPAADGALFSASEAHLCLAARHLRDVLAQFADGLAYIEAMLTKQLSAAIGKEVTPADFATFMAQHEAKLYDAHAAPQPLSFAVRRPGHSPEGAVAIEGGAGAGGRDDEPIRALGRRVDSTEPYTFALNAATRVTFHGERHLHAYLAHEFGGDDDGPSEELHLSARARQFSAFILLVGRLGAGRTFEPKSALIVQNKDEVRLPLLLEQLPTPKAFRDAIASLSPEQRRFAQAYRAMQLEGSVFGVLVLQLKPQLERVLNLPADALTKEIALTQQLLDLFITYQVPADLLSYDGDAAANATSKVGAVRHHVGGIAEMIAAAKKEEVAASKQKYEYDRPSARHEEAEDAEADGAPVGRAAPRSKMMMRSARSAPKAYAASAATDEVMADEPPMVEMMMAAPAMAMADAPMPQRLYKMAGGGGGGGGNSAAQTSQQPQQPQQQQTGSAQATAGDAAQTIDFTAVPAQLEAAYNALDVDAAIRPTKINVGDVWRRRSQPGLLATPTEKPMFPAEQEREKAKAFDLIDALSRSGALAFEAASLHAVVAATHRFDDSLVHTVIQGNVNPIERLERSSLIIASTIHGEPVDKLLQPAQRERVAAYSAPKALPSAAA